MDHERKLEETPLQGFDLRLAAALHDVPVPAGLAGRLMARLQAEAPAVRSEVLPLAEAAVPARRFAFSRRAKAAVLAGLAVAASLCVYVISAGDAQAPDALELAANWSTSWSNQSASWAALKSRPKGFDVPTAIRVPAAGWMRVDGIVGRAGVAYDLGGAGRTAVLFVVRIPADTALPSTPPAAPQASTGGSVIGVWQSGGLRYVLVVKGEVRDYRDLIHSNHAPLTWSPSLRLPSLPIGQLSFSG